MDIKEVLKQLSLDSAQETYTTTEFDEVEGRTKELRYITGKTGHTLLLGTSDSEMTAWRNKFGGKPVGVSLDSKWEDKDILKQDMHDLDFPDEEFDFVYCSQTLEHSPAPIIALMQIERVLKKGGNFFFWMPFDWENQNVKYHYSCFDPQIWISLIRKAGLCPNAFCQDKNSFGYYGEK